MFRINKMLQFIDLCVRSLNNWFCRNFEWFFTNGIKAEYLKNWYDTAE